MKRRYKVLPLSFPHTHERVFWANCVGDEIAPRFNRNGRYMDRKLKQAWVEIDGRAWLYADVGLFLYDLARTGARRLDEQVYQALYTLLFTPGTGISWRSRVDLHHKWLVENDLRESDRDRLTMKKFLKSL